MQYSGEVRGRVGVAIKGYQVAAGQGGRRPGAGRPPGGISEARRLIERALRAGMAQAMRDRGSAGDDDELAVAAAADVVRGMMLGGQGDRVLTIWASLAPKEAPGSGGESSPDADQGDGLAGWLRRAPGSDAGPISARLPVTLDSEPAPARVGGAGPADCASAGPGDSCAPGALPGQRALGIDAPERAPAGSIGPRAERVDAPRAPGAPAPGSAPTPTPPPAPAPASIHPRAPFFDFSGARRMSAA